MRKSVSLSWLIESNKEKLINNQMFIDRVKEKRIKSKWKCRKNHKKKAGDDDVIEKSLVFTTNDYLS
ncbi:hypothetical protein [Peribacillus sp. NPDC097895]|uniref:hypothetical protein n=1 Tax=Peribacillus sp. NPDC097895 TaxID=3390619 RepID=UPI003D07C3D6